MVSPADQAYKRTLMVRSLFRQSATIRRAPPTGKDPEGVDTYGPLADHLIDEPCRWWITGDEEVVGVDQTVILKRYHFQFPHGADIVEADVITNVKDQTGAVVIAGPLDVQIAYDVEQYRAVQAEG